MLSVNDGYQPKDMPVGVGGRQSASLNKIATLALAGNEIIN
jgi:hypothetical protein